MRPHGQEARFLDHWKSVILPRATTVLDFVNMYQLLTLALSDVSKYAKPPKQAQQNSLSDPNAITSIDDNRGARKRQIYPR